MGNDFHQELANALKTGQQAQDNGIRPKWKGEIDELDPAYRYLKAKQLLDDDGCQPASDPQVKRMVQYLRHREKEDDGESMWVDSIYPNLHPASKIYDDRQATLKDMHIRCGILANADPEDVADLVVSIGPEVVREYETFFFNVREHLDNPVFIVENVIKTVSPQMEYPVGEGGVTWQISAQDLRLLLAYYGGWEQHLAWSGGRPGMTVEASNILKGVGQRNELFKAVLASMTEKVDGDNASSVLDRHAAGGARPMNEEDEVVEEKKMEDRFLQKMGELAEDAPIEAAQEGDLNEEHEYVEVI